MNHEQLPPNPFLKGFLSLAALLAISGTLTAQNQPAYSVVDLGSVGGNFVSAFAVNERGDVAERAELPSRVSHAFLDRNGAIADLGTLTGRTNSRGQGIAKGKSSDGRSPIAINPMPMRSCTPAAPCPIFTRWFPIGGSASFANAIDEIADIAGDVLTLNDTEDHAILFRRGSVLDLGTLGGTFSISDAVNSQDQVVGTSTLPGDQVAQAFFWNGAMVPLGSLGEASAMRSRSTRKEP
jgi:probable HAF family extracellular repeat protein